MGTGVQTTGMFARNNPTCLQRAGKDKLHEVDQVKSKDQKASGKKSVWERCLQRCMQFHTWSDTLNQQ